METLLIGRKEVEESLATQDILNAIEKTFLDNALGKTTNPPKLTLDLGALSNYPSYGGFINAMPAYVGWLDIAGLKWAGAIPERMKRGHSSITGLMILLEPKSGNFLAVLDGLAITEMRFAAQDAVALKYLAVKNNIDVGFLGGGEQVLLHLKFLREYFTIHNVYIDEACDNDRKFFTEFITGEINCLVTASDIAYNSDAIFGLGKSSEPVITRDNLRKGAVVFPLGSYNRWCHEDLLLGGCEISVDHPEQCLEKGELSSLVKAGKLNMDSIAYTIGELISDPGLASPEKTKICIPIGIGALDVALGGICYMKLKNVAKGFDFGNYV